MAAGDKINIRPHFKNEKPGLKEGNDRLPCDGEAGDLYVFTSLYEGEKDSSPDSPLGVAQLWFCTKGAEGDNRNAIWQRVGFDGHITCDAPPPKPPQNTPRLDEKG